MKRINSRFVILISITIAYGFCVGYFIMKESENFNDLLSYIATILSIACCLFAFLKTRLNRFVYVSLKDAPMCQNVLMKLKGKFKSRIIITAHEHLEAGEIIQNLIKHKIAQCSFCVVLIDGDLTSLQKKEIKEMKLQKKRIIPVLLSDETELPAILSNITPLKYSDL